MKIFSKTKLEANNDWFERQGKWKGESHLCDMLIGLIGKDDKIMRDILLSFKNQAEFCLSRIEYDI